MITYVLILKLLYPPDGSVPHPIKVGQFKTIKECEAAAMDLELSKSFKGAIVQRAIIQCVPEVMK